MVDEEYQELDVDNDLMAYLQKSRQAAENSAPPKKSPLRFLKNLWVLLPITFFAALGYILLRGDTPITGLEVRLLIVVGLLMIVTFIIAMFMVRNAVVANTKYLLSLRKSLTLNQKMLDKVAKDFQHAGRSLSSRSDHVSNMLDKMVTLTANLLKMFSGDRRDSE